MLLYIFAKQPRIVKFFLLIGIKIIRLINRDGFPRFPDKAADNLLDIYVGGGIILLYGQIENNIRSELP